MAQIQRSEDVGLEKFVQHRPEADLDRRRGRGSIGRVPVYRQVLAAEGYRPPLSKMGRAVRYRPEDVEEYERQALVETQAQSDRTPV